MDVISDIDLLRERLGALPRPRGLVPTMGALHDGHLSLVRTATSTATVVVSIFVNPLQFGPGEDFERYPRDLDADLALLDAAGVDVVFSPDAAAFTPSDRRTTVTVAGLTDVLEGASRPGHFDGVTTIVAKLFNAVQPDRAFFGEKDFQQLAVIRQMATDLNQPVQIVGCPTVREPDGLALSSRNVYLQPDDRRTALRIWVALQDAAAAWDGDADAARRRLRAGLEDAEGLTVDYAEVADPASLQPLRGTGHAGGRALVAAVVGGTRLIDNVALG